MSQIFLDHKRWLTSLYAKNAKGQRFHTFVSLCKVTKSLVAVYASNDLSDPELKKMRGMFKSEVKSNTEFPNIIYVWLGAVSQNQVHKTPYNLLLNGKVNHGNQKYDVAKHIQIKDQETIKDIAYVKEILEEQSGMRISYQNALNHIIKQFLAEK